MNEKLVVTMNEASDLLRVSRQTIYRYMNNDENFPKSIHLSKRKIVFRLDALKSWLEQKEQK